MSTKRIRFVTTVCAVLAVVTLGARLPLRADQPEPQLRYFALFPAGPIDDPAPPPDLTSPDSVLLVVHSGQHAENVPAFTFGEDAPSDLLAGTTWWARTPATHVTSDGTESFYLFWLDELAPNGAVATTGPDGDAQFIGAFYVRPAAGSEAGGDTTKWWVDDEPAATARVMYIGAGFFSK